MSHLSIALEMKQLSAATLPVRLCISWVLQLSLRASLIEVRKVNAHLPFSILLLYQYGIGNPPRLGGLLDKAIVDQFLGFFLDPRTSQV